MQATIKNTLRAPVTFRNKALSRSVMVSAVASALG